MSMSRKPASVDEAFVQALPKVELHAHLTGSISRRCLHDIWQQRKAEEPTLSIEDPLLAMPDGKVDWDINTFFPLFSSYIYSLCSTLTSIQQSTLSVLEDFYADGVVHLELRTTPRAIPANSLSKEDYVSAVLDVIDVFNKSHSSMRTTLILSIDRRNDTATADEVVSLAQRFKHKGVVGVDLCGDPAKGNVSIFRDAFARAKKAGLYITLHFGEIAASGTDEELETLLSFHPERLGHVIHVDEKWRKVIEERKLGLELCLSCNVHAKMVRVKEQGGGFADHHFGEWRGRGCPLALSTDDVGVFCSPVSNEYALAANHFGLERRDIVDLSRGAIEVIFDGEEEKARLRGLLDRFEEEYVTKQALV